MGTCGYICPLCEGRGYLENGEACDWCTVSKPSKPEEIEEWLRAVHEGPCCGDLGIKDEKNLPGSTTIK